MARPDEHAADPSQSSSPAGSTPTEPTASPIHGGGARPRRGSCHCGSVEYHAELDLAAGVSRCNCSVCTKTSASSMIVKPAAFALLKGEESLATYEWGGKTSQRYFCKHCGVHCFGKGHLAEVGGDYVAINANTLDGVELKDLTAVYWDGRHDNWQAGPRRAPWPMLESA